MSEPGELGTQDPRQSKIRAWWGRPATRLSLKRAALRVGLPITVFAILLGLAYIRVARRLDERLAGGVFVNSMDIYAAPLTFTVGDGLTLNDITTELQSAGYQASLSPEPATWRVGTPGSIEIIPAPGGEPAVTIGITNGQIVWIQSQHRSIREFTIQSPKIATISSGDREQRRIVTFAQIPPVLVHAVISAEDKHFFHHDGFDLPRIAKAAWVDAMEHRKEEGASTLTMQLARGLWLERAKTWRRKAMESLMAIHLESRWSKEKIFATYANQVYLGRLAASNIQGFAAGARLYFGKSMHDLTLPEAALLAGMVQRPSYDNPLRYPEHAQERRNVVLALMRDNHYITPEQYEASVATPVHMVESGDRVSSPWFLDLVNDELQNRAGEERNAKIVRTTLDLNLQRAAEQAVAAGLEEVDRQLSHRYALGHERAQAALIALDPHTGEIKAVVGGRDYSRSQLNHIFAERPPGSVFKPFVYAAALNTALNGANRVYTPATIVDDSPSTFFFGGRSYQPSNFKHEFYGEMTLREALARSDNTAAVKVSEGVGLQAVVAMARSAGLNDRIQPTPAVALGAYDTTPLEIAGAYTIFANGGIWVKPTVVSDVEDDRGTSDVRDRPESRKAIDPALAWLMANMLEEVLRSGTGAGVRVRGFLLPAAGKTGTSHDGWFAGFTNQLLCVVWVGFDDYSDLGLEGAKSALPIWTNFMTRATKLAAWKNAHEFPMPSGIEKKDICLDDGALAGDSCANIRAEYFIQGSAPEPAPPASTTPGSDAPSPVTVQDDSSIPAAKDENAPQDKAPTETTSPDYTREDSENQ